MVRPVRLALAGVLVVVAAGLLGGSTRAQGAEGIAVEPLPGAEAYGTEIPEARTRFSATYAAANGSQTTIFSLAPLNYSDASGLWQVIDTSLVASAGGYANAANDFSLHLPADLASPVTVSSGQASVGFTLLGASPSKSAVVSGSDAVYAEALHGVDLRYTSLPQGLKESISLASAASPSSLSFALSSSAGLAAVQAGDGLQLRGKNGVAAFDLSAPFAQDASGARGRVRVSLAGATLTLTVDPAWLSDPARVFPVTVDPTVSPNLSSDCTLSNGGSANTSFCAATTLDVGYDGTTTSRSVAKFDLSAIPTNVKVDNAELKLYLASESTTASASVNVYPLSRTFTSAATWNKYDGTNAWTAPGGDFAATPAVAASAGGTLGWLSWYPTQTVTQWLNGTLTNNGFLVKQASEGSTTNMLHFSSSESTTNKPQLVVAWHYSVGDGRQYTMISQKIDDRLALNVNVANGNLMLQAQDLQLPGVAGLNLNVERTFNSMSGTTWFTGSHWQLNLAPMVYGRRYGDGSIRYVDPSGQELLFTPTTLNGTTQSYAAATAVDATLTKDTSAGTYALVYNKSGIKLSFNASLVLLKINDRNGNTITVNWSGGYVTGYTDTHGQTTSLTYDSTHTVITDVSFPSGRSVHYTYDSDNDFLASTTDSNGKTTTFTQDPTTYDLTAITDPRGNQTKISYYTSGFYTAVHTVTRVTNPATGTGPTWTFTYNSGNTVVQDPNGKNWTYRFDKQDRVTEIDDPLGRTTLGDFAVYSGCPSGEQGGGFDDSNGGALTGDNGAVGNACFDSKNNQTRTLDPGNANGRRATALATYADPNNVYAANTNTDANGGIWNYAYDTSGNLCAKSEGTATTRLTCTGGSGQGQNPITFVRNSLGQVTSSTDGRGNSTTYGYNATTHDLTSVTYPTSTPALPAIALTYDTVHRLSTVTDGKGQLRTYTYDAMDRILTIQYKDSGGTVSDTVTYAYDDNGNVRTRNDAGGTTTYTYDQLNRLTNEQKPDLTNIGYGYDANSQLSSLTEPDGTTGYGYDDAGRLASVIEPYAPTGNSGKISYAYSLNSTTHQLTTTITYPNGATSVSVEDPGRRVESIIGKDGAGTTQASYAYAYEYVSGATTNDGFLRRSMTWSLNGSSPETTAFGYDSLGRLVQANPLAGVNYQYCYDANGNLLAKAASCGTPTYHYNANNEQTDSGYSYDANGNETAIPADPTLVYNPKDQTSSITPSGGSAQSQSYAGPGQNERLTDGASTSFLNDALGLGRRTASGSSIYFTRSPDGTILGERTTGAAAGNYYYLLDGQGSVVGLTNSTGSLVATYKYDPYGKISYETPSAPFNPIRYANYYWNPSYNTYKVGARYYDPNIGRWTQRDPAENALDTHGWNQYDYASDDPVNMVDPSGMFGLDDIAHVASIVDEALGAVATAGLAIGGTYACLAAVTGVGAIACASILLVNGVTSAVLTYQTYRNIKHLSHRNPHRRHVTRWR